MKRALFFAFGTILLASLVPTPAAAQTTANGPYYALPAWDQKLQCDTPATCPRFIVLANWRNAVLDRETGLVWQRSPSGSFPSDWASAHFHCTTYDDIEERYGWRLPAIQELASLLTNRPGAGLPPGHPFQFGAGVMRFWSASTVVGAPTQAWGIFFDSGSFANSVKTSDQMSGAWCVRGGAGLDHQ